GQTLARPRRRRNRLQGVICSSAAGQRHRREEDYMSYRRTTVNGAVGALLSALALSLMSCAQPLTTREKGTLAGGTLGAATGAIIGGATGWPGAGAAVGGALASWAGGRSGDRLCDSERVA